MESEKTLQQSKKRLICCPSCESRGLKNILGEIDENGDFVVLRFHKRTTRFRGEKFSVVCDECKEEVFYRT